MVVDCENGEHSEQIKDVLSYVMIEVALLIFSFMNCEDLKPAQTVLNFSYTLLRLIIQFYMARNILNSSNLFQKLASAKFLTV